MPKRSRKQSTRINEMARSMVDQLTSEDREILTEENLTVEQIAARVLGRKGGLKGGTARAKKLSAPQRRAIAKKAALARWKK